MFAKDSGPVRDLSSHGQLCEVGKIVESLIRSMDAIKLSVSEAVRLPRKLHPAAGSVDTFNDAAPR